MSLRPAPDKQCPACSAREILLFFEARSMPVNCAVVFDSREEAARAPLGDLRLGFCSACGFIYNFAFDPALLKTDGSYEDQQGFSPTFRRYAEWLANHLVGKWNLHEKTVVEIGCGKGDFLQLICKLGNSRGIGIDPIAEFRGMDEDIIKKITLVNEYYSETHGTYNGDIIICRHTLEHVPQPLEFIDTISRSISGKSGTIVVFEVPDVVRILEERAFWDIYYEHCGYFSFGSMANLFRRCRFEITSLERVYAGQYIILEAKRVQNISRHISEREETPAELSNRVSAFSQEIAKKMKRWSEEISRARAKGEKVVVWGSGSKCVAFLSTFDLGGMIEYVVDINPNRQGKYVPVNGAEIVSPRALSDYRPDCVIIMNSAYRDEITHTLNDLGLKPIIKAV